MTHRFDGKVALVTGASSGIGRATARHLARAGATVALVARRAEALAALAEELGAEGAMALPFAADLVDAGGREALAAAVTARLGGVDHLVNAAGIIGFGTQSATSLADWSQMLEINVTAPFHLTQLLLPGLRRGPGSVVHVSSVTGLRAFPGVLAYAVSKAAVDQLTRCSALELAAEGVRVNAVNPGVVVSGLHRAGGLDEARYAAFLEHSKGTHPLGRVGQPEEVAQLIAFLLSADAGWVTGTTVAIDGGRHLTCAR